MQVDTPALIDKLRQIAGEPAGDDIKKIRAFNEIMLGSMKTFGRVYEFGLMGHYKLRTRDFFADLGKFPTMLIKGKMKLFPHFAKGRKSVSAIFDRTRARRRAK
jgi:heterodisulfide reductase subunit C